ncbi:hypothetical protein [Actinomadura physcomitrii]|uniref:hypothetical protein n=1 Tax=Actinomadura physcomitrii TaxID=2650748 RepID=UPI00136AEB60|nr:hypothetical protein [Actinomadura physcomitrii]
MSQLTAEDGQTIAEQLREVQATLNKMVHVMHLQTMLLTAEHPAAAPGPRRRHLRLVEPLE